MSGDDDKRGDDEAFFTRWSRRKQQVQRQGQGGAGTDKPAAQAAAGDDEAAVIATDAGKGAAAGGHAPAPAEAPADERKASDARAPGGVLTEADFAEVDFSSLTYGSDYSRFLEPGVPESIRQKALSQLWHSDEMFTQVDPFQDYAGDYTDAAVVPASGVVKTIYKVGQGFLSDDEARTWDRLDKAEPAAAMAALEVLRPGYRVRRATVDDAVAMADVQRAAILMAGKAEYGDAVAASWASGLTGELVASRLADGAIIDVAIDEDSGEIAALCGRSGRHIAALFTRPGHARRGLARRLVERAVAEIEVDGEARGVMTTAASRLSRALFERHGWRGGASREYQTRGGALLEVVDMSRPLVSAATLKIERETPLQPAVAAMLTASDAYAAALYPAESNHLVDADALAAAGVTFVVARLNGEAVGCGAVVVRDDDAARGETAGERVLEGEIKRLWVAPAQRGLRLGVRLMATLETAARDGGANVLRLETGIHQPEAIALYRRLGFQERAPFGSYQPDPISLFMEKRLA